MLRVESMCVVFCLCAVYLLCVARCGCYVLRVVCGLLLVGDCLVWFAFECCMLVVVWS